MDKYRLYRIEAQMKSDFDSSMTAVAALRDSTRADFADVRRQMGTGFATVATGFAAQETGLAAQETAIAAMQTGLAGIQTGLADVKTGLADVKTGLADMQTGLADMQTGHADMKTGLAAVETGIADTKTAMNELHENVTASLDKLSGTMDEGLGRVGSCLETYVQHVSEGFAELRQGVTDLSDLSGRYESLDARVTRLEGQSPTGS